MYRHFGHSRIDYVMCNMPSRSTSRGGQNLVRLKNILFVYFMALNQLPVEAISNLMSNLTIRDRRNMALTHCFNLVTPATTNMNGILSALGSAHSSAWSAKAACSLVTASFRPLDIPISSCCFVSPRSRDHVFSFCSPENGIMWFGGGRGPAKVDSLEGKGESKSELTASQIAIKATA
eukprot:SAG22_NODE_406_length_10984_cov_28.344970_13_plen_178_part_00